MLSNFKKLIGLAFATVLLFSISTTSFAIDKLHFVIGGGAGGGWDRPLAFVILILTSSLLGWQIFSSFKR